MTRILIAALCLVFAFALVACVVVEKDEFNVIDPDDAELARSVELGNNILAAFRDEDFAKLRKNIPGPLQTKMTEKDFKTSCDNWRDTLGKIRVQ